MAELLEMEDLPAPVALHRLNSVVQAIEVWPAWQAALAHGQPKGRADWDLTQTEAVIVEGFACSLLKCERSLTRIERLISDTDPAVLARLVQRVVAWQKELLLTDEKLPWPKYRPDILAYVLRQAPPYRPTDWPGHGFGLLHR